MDEVRSQSRGGLIDGQCLPLESSDCLLPGLPDDVALNCLARASRSDYDSLSCVNKRFHKLTGSGDLYELRKKLGIVEHWVYLSCDPYRWVAFDPARNKWMALPKIPSDTGFNLAYKHSIAVDTELLLFGLEVPYRVVIWKYSLIGQGWVKCEGMNNPRCEFGSGSFGSTAVVAGGLDENKKVLKSAELYDSSTGKWETLPNMKTPRMFCSGFFMDGKFYVIGGVSGPRTTDPLTSGEEYDFETRKWRMIEGMNPYVNGYICTSPVVAVVDNQLYAMERLTNTLRKYDKANNTWNVLGGLPGLGLDCKACGRELVGVHSQKGPEGESVVLYSWCPKSGVSNGTLIWKVLGTKDHVSVFKDNCAVMSC